MHWSVYFDLKPYAKHECEITSFGRLIESESHQKTCSFENHVHVSIYLANFTLSLPSHGQSYTSQVVRNTSLKELTKLH